MPYPFYGGDRVGTLIPREPFTCISSPQMLYDILSRLWCAETCAPRMRENWTQENKTLGQCSVTAFLAQDVFGGEVRGILREGGNYHCYNVVAGWVFDLTSEQFAGEKLCYDSGPVQLRETHFAKEEKYRRYLYLRQALTRYCEGLDSGKASTGE